MIPDYCEPITAYRCWDVFPNGLLCGQAVQEPWPPYQAMVARCATTGGSFSASRDTSRGYAAHVSPDGHWIDAPVFKCDCGIHAYKTADAAQRRVLDDPNGHSYFSSRPAGRAWGALQLWGKLVEHEQGYRAQFAYPSVLWCEDAQLAATIAQLYGVACALKTLDRPTPKKDEDWRSAYYYFTRQSPFVFSPIVAPAPPVQQPGLIQGAKLAQIQAIGASRYQQQIDRRAANRAAKTPDWRDIMDKAFHKCKSTSEISE